MELVDLLAQFKDLKAVADDYITMAKMALAEGDKGAKLTLAKCEFACQMSAT